VFQLNYTLVRQFILPIEVQSNLQFQFFWTILQEIN